MANSQKSGGIGGFFKKLAIVVAIIGVILHLKGVHIPTLLITLGMTAQTGVHGFYGLGLLLQESVTSHPPPTFVSLGYWNALQLKFIYVSRFVMKDNFLFEDWLETVHQTVLKDFEARGLPKDQDVEYAVPIYDAETVDPMYIFNTYVQTGRPVVLRNAKVGAMSWTADNLASRFGNFRTPLRCMNGSVVTMTLQEYVDSGKSGNPPCYFDNNANIFEKNPVMNAELEVDRFSIHMTGKPSPKGQSPEKYLFAQLFLSVFPGTGALFHCANYNNLFYMIRGSKKWTFVDPANSFMIYPFFNSMFKDSKSWLTWHVTHAKNSSEIIQKFFPLYRYTPKLLLTLQPGDLLMNPPWNWHQVENIGDEVIGVATRWRFPSTFFTWYYTNALFSLCQFLSEDFFTFMYRRIASLKFGAAEFIYKPTSHGNLDAALNFGRDGSIYKKRDFITQVSSPTQWDGYLKYLNETNYFMN